MIATLVILQILSLVVIAVLAVALLAIARQVGVLYERVAPAGALTTASGPEVGGPAPHLTLPTLDGGRIELGGALPAGRNRLLMFVSSHCPICKNLIPTARKFARDERLEVVFAGDAPEDEQRALIARFDIGDLPFVNSAELGRVYGVEKLPHAVLLGDDGTVIARGLVNSREHLESLVVARDMGLRSVQDYLRTRKQPEAVSA